MIIQITGLPCSGKSHVIDNLKQRIPELVCYDIADYSSKDRESQLFKELKDAQNKPYVIVESVCGINFQNSIIVRLSVDQKTHKRRIASRKETIDIHYMSLLSSEMRPAKYTVASSQALETLVYKLLETN